MATENEARKLLLEGFANITDDAQRIKVMQAEADKAAAVVDVPSFMIYDELKKDVDALMALKQDKGPSRPVLDFTLAPGEVKLAEQINFDSKLNLAGSSTLLHVGLPTVANVANSATASLSLDANNNVTSGTLGFRQVFPEHKIGPYIKALSIAEEALTVGADGKLSAGLTVGEAARIPAINTSVTATAATKISGKGITLPAVDVGVSKDYHVTDNFTVSPGAGGGYNFETGKSNAGASVMFSEQAGPYLFKQNLGFSAVDPGGKNQDLGVNFQVSVTAKPENVSTLFDGLVKKPELPQPALAAEKPVPEIAAAGTLQATSASLPIDKPAPELAAASQAPEVVAVKAPQVSNNADAQLDASLQKMSDTYYALDGSPKRQQAFLGGLVENVVKHTGADPVQAKEIVLEQLESYHHVNVQAATLGS